MPRFIVFVLITLLAATNQGYAARLLGVSADTGNVYEINTSTPGSPIFKFSLGAGKDIAGLAYSQTRRTYFAYSRAENKIYEFNTAGTILGTITPDRVLSPSGTSPRGIAFDPTGKLYVVGANNNVYQLNLATGQTYFRFKAMGSTSQVESLATLDNQAFYAVGVRSQVFSVNRFTGQLTNLATLAVGDLDAMTGTIGGTLFMSESGPDSQLHAYSPLTRTYQSLGWTGISHLSSLEELWPNAK
jgi:DNA-binding beta-propeller fold protein YncE